MCKSAIYFFLAGAAAWDVLTHFGLKFFGLLPFKVGAVEFTPQLNTIIMAVAGLLALFFLYQGFNAHRAECHYKLNDKKNEL